MLTQFIQKAKENGIWFRLTAKLLFCCLAIYDSWRNFDSNELCYGNRKKKRSPISFFICENIAAAAVVTQGLFADDFKFEKSFRFYKHESQPMSKTEIMIFFL